MIKIEKKYAGTVTPLVVSETLVYETKDTSATTKIKFLGITLYSTYYADNYVANPPVSTGKKDKLGF